MHSPCAKNIVACRERVRVDVKMKVGSTSQTVEVPDVAPLVQTDSASLGEVVDQTNVSTLPLDSLNFVSFTYLVAGTPIPAEGSDRGGTRGKYCRGR
jgi:hypothetical protein